MASPAAGNGARQDARERQLAGAAQDQFEARKYDACLATLRQLRGERKTDVGAPAHPLAPALHTPPPLCTRT